MAPLSLAYYGDPILRKRAPLVEEITPEIRTLAELMVEELGRHDAIGLAATQVKHLARMFVIRFPNYDEVSWIPQWGEVEIIINPVLSDPSPEERLDREGCLSIPGIHGEVFRPCSITLTAVDLHGNPIHRRLEGYNARAAMHETDHLNGKLFIDRMKGKAREAIEPRLRMIQKQYTER